MTQPVQPEPGTPPGMTNEDVSARSELARFLGPAVFPADREALLHTARENQATDAVLAVLAELPNGMQWQNVQEVARALGIGTETRRT